MTLKQRPATVLIQMTATDEKGNPLGGVTRSVHIHELRNAKHPLLVELAATAATSLDEIVCQHYQFVPRFSV